MKKSSFKIIELQKIKTKEGYMFPIYKDWDDIHEGFIPEMVYATTISAGMSKDIIYHKKRTSFLTSIQGEMLIEMMVEGKVYKEILSKEDGNSKSKIVMIDPCVPFRLTNAGTQVGIIINCPTYAWRPNSDEMIKFESWEKYEQWKG